MASAALAELVLRITGQDNASPAVTTMGSRIRKELTDIGKLAAGLAIGNLGANLAMGVADRLKDAATQIDTYGKAVLQVQRITGQSAEESSTLVAVFERYAPSIDEATTRLARFEKSLAGADDALDLVSTGGKTGVQYLQQLGVAVTDAQGKMRPTTAILLDLAEGFRASNDAQLKMGALTALFGRGSQDMLLMLNQGRAGLQGFMQDAQKYGLVLNSTNVKDVAAFIAAHKQMDLALQGVALQMGAAFMPAVTGASEVVMRLAQAINQAVLPALREIPAAMPTVIALLGTVFVAAAARATVATVQFVVTGLRQLAAGIAMLAVPMGSLIARYAGVAAAATASAAAQVAAWVVAAGPITLIISGLVLAIGAIALALSGKLGEAKDALLEGIHNLAEGAKTGWETITKLVDPAAFAAGLETGQEFTDGIAQGIQESASEKVAKAAKETADAVLKKAQDAAAGRKIEFDQAHVDQETQVLQTKLEQTIADQALLGYKRQMEDLDRTAVDFAAKRHQLDEDDAATQAKIAEAKIKSQSDDLSYQEKLLVAQARAARMRGESVDMGALRGQLLRIRQSQIQMEPGLLVAEHQTALADRTKQSTDMAASLATNALERQKLAIQEAMRPYEEAGALAKRMAEDSAAQLELDKQRFAIHEQEYAAELLAAQATAKAADEAYRAAVAAAQANGRAPDTGTAPLSNGIGAPGTADQIGPKIEITNNNTVRNDDDVAAIASRTADQVMEQLRAAQRQVAQPARSGLPGAVGSATA